MNKTPLFVHVPKTAGTMLRGYFRKCCSGIQIHEHNLVSQLSHPDKYFKYAFVRNPWDWYVSRYFYFCRQKPLERGVSIKCDSGLCGNPFKLRFPTLKSHLMWGLEEDVPGFWFSDRIKNMCFVNGHDVIDLYVTYENLSESVNKILRTCNIQPKMSFDYYTNDPDNQKNRNATTHKHYSAYYDDELRELVVNKDKEIIEKHNYSFQGIQIESYQFCTVSDYNYLNQGLCMYDSLLRYCEKPFKLRYLCIDDKAYTKLIELKMEGTRLEHLEPYSIDHIPELRNNDKRLYTGYCWSLGSRFCNYIINTWNYGEHILYVDSDVMFYPGVDKIFEEVKYSSIGIIPHLHVGVGSEVGGYNVGIIYFKNDKVGKECCKFWVDCVLDKHPEYKGTYDTCGDQKFLELFVQKWYNETIVIGSTVGHGAPWNDNGYNYDQFSLEDKKINIPPGKVAPDFDFLWGKTLPLVFHHFAGFGPDYINDTYSATRERFNERFLDKPRCKELYDEYYRKMKETKSRYGL